MATKCTFFLKFWNGFQNFRNMIGKKSTPSSVRKACILHDIYRSYQRSTHESTLAKIERHCRVETLISREGRLHDRGFRKFLATLFNQIQSTAGDWFNTLRTLCKLPGWAVRRTWKGKQTNRVRWWNAALYHGRSTFRRKNDVSHVFSLPMKEQMQVCWPMLFSLEPH